MSLCITALLAASPGTGCQLVFHSDIDAAASDAARTDAGRVDAPTCAAFVQIETNLNQDTYIAKALDINFDNAAAMQVNGQATVGLLEFRTKIDDVTATLKPQFLTFELTVPIVTLTPCTLIGCTATCTQTEGEVHLELLKDSDWDEAQATWTKRTDSTRWAPAGAFDLPDNLGTIAISNSTITNDTITFSVDPNKSAMLWSALSSAQEWSFRLSAANGVMFAYADQSGITCSIEVPAPSLKVTYCP